MPESRECPWQLRTREAACLSRAEDRRHLDLWIIAFPLWPVPQGCNDCLRSLVITPLPSKGRDDFPPGAPQKVHFCLQSRLGPYSDLHIWVRPAGIPDRVVCCSSPIAPRPSRQGTLSFTGWPGSGLGRPRPSHAETWVESRPQTHPLVTTPRLGF